ncbi:MAG: RagB/SusD family nutrient uptake outer membrane protein [Bacteroidales bacterium]|nr:RagB/SusD family nutrient uptake outer membrane protein [Bacteroidales bacterium]MDY6000883.1 RagB/SusD family nutrient uptake outer membrane protein [Candidatus Cryptobacteroides sp.]
MKKIFILISSAASLLGITACNDSFLELYPKGTVTEATAFASYEAANDYTLNMYTAFSGGFAFVQGPSMVNSGLGTSTKDIYSGLLTDYSYGYQTVPNSFAAQTVTLPTSTTSEYYYPYEWIRRCNILLDHLDDMKDATDAQKTHLEAVARFFRAYAHYQLLVNYGDCIYVDHNITGDSEEMTAARNSRQYVTQQIYDELKWVINNIQDDLADANTINSDVAKAFMSRFCLFEGTWRKYHGDSDDNYVTANELLKECVSVSAELAAKYPTLYKGDNNDKHPGKGWGQMWTSEDDGVIPGILLYVKYLPDYNMHRMGHFEHIASACLEMPQSTVDLYLTVDGLPIHNANVKTYEYDGINKTYAESATPYDYANVDPYKTFRKRDPRMWQMITPPYKVIRKGTNYWTYDDGGDGMYSEYVLQFAPRGRDKGDGSYEVPNFNNGYHQIETHKSLPSTNWAGNILPNMPNTQMSGKNDGYKNGKIGYYGGYAFQRGKGGYFVWKHVANWDKQWSSGTADVANKPVFKIEEVLLNYAEAAFELGSFNQTIADATINRLRDRAEVGRMLVSAIGDDFDPDRDQTVDPVLWEIRRERLIELMGEGFSFDDVKRWKKGEWYVNKQHYGAWVNYSDLDNIVSRTGGETGVMDNNTHLEASLATAQEQGGGHLYYYLDPVLAGVGWLDKYYLYPIPTEEIGLNENLTQNPGW